MADDVRDDELEEFVDDDEVSEGDVACCSCDGVVVAEDDDGDGEDILYCWYCDAVISDGDGDADENVSVLVFTLLVLLVLLLVLVLMVSVVVAGDDVAAAAAAVVDVADDVLSLDGGGRTTMLALRELRCVLRMGAIPSSVSFTTVLLRLPSVNVVVGMLPLRIMLSL